MDKSGAGLHSSKPERRKLQSVSVTRMRVLDVQMDKRDHIFGMLHGKIQHELDTVWI